MGGAVLQAAESPVSAVGCEELSRSCRSVASLGKCAAELESSWGTFALWIRHSESGTAAISVFLTILSSPWA